MVDLSTTHRVSHILKSRENQFLMETRKFSEFLNMKSSLPPCQTHGGSFIELQ